MTRLTDHDAAARAGVSQAREHDQPPKYTPADHPAGERLSMDPGRFAADGWRRCEGLAFEPHDTGTPSKFRWWHRCPCGRTLEASSREALERKFKQHGAES